MITEYEFKIERYLCVCASCKQKTSKMNTFKDEITSLMICESCARELTNDNGHKLCLYQSYLNASERKKLIEDYEV